MFTGIIRSKGIVRHVSDEAMPHLTIGTSLGRLVRSGDSVAVNGACLTVLKKTNTGMVFRLMDETVKRTALGTLMPGSGVNLERPVRAQESFDGHFVLGHVDGVVKIVK